MTDLDIAQLEKKIQQLPPQIAIEVNDYVDFLLQKYQNDFQKQSKKPLCALKKFRALHPELQVSSVDLMCQLRDEQAVGCISKASYTSVNLNHIHTPCTSCPCTILSLGGVTKCPFQPFFP